MKNKIKGLNRRIFKRNLKKVLNGNLLKYLDYNFEMFVQDYKTRLEEGTTRCGYFEVSATEHKEKRAEEIRTN